MSAQDDPKMPDLPDLPDMAELANMPDPADMGWASLGTEALPGERDDDALLRGVLAHMHHDANDDAGAAVEPPQAQTPRRAPWGLLALVAAAAAVLLFLLMPKAWLGFESATDVDELAPDVVESKDTELHAEPGVHARGPAPSTPSQQAVVHASPPTQAPAKSTPTAPGPTEAVARPKPRRPPPSVASADDMLRTAQDTLARGDRGAALVAYQALVAAHPGSGEARAAWVSIGRIHLRAGRAKPALQAFDTYLKTPRGALRQEARYGRLQAFQKQDARADERREIEAFMRDFPRSLYTARLQTRLEALQ